MNKNQRNIVLLFAVLVFMVTGGCSYLGVVPYPQIVKGRKQLLYEGKFNQAAQTLAKGIESGNNRVLYLMEQGTIQNIQGDYQASIRSFEQALSLIQDFEERAVVSARGVASQLFSLPANDNAIPYHGYAFERVLVNTYQALNYLFLGNLEGARVEVRRADQRQIKELELHNKEISEYQEWGKNRKITISDYPAFQKAQKKMQKLSGSVLDSFQNAFTYYLSGIVYELGGEENDAYIDYKKTHQLSPHFICVQSDLLRLSRKLGFQEEYAEWVNRFGNVLSKDDKEASPQTGAEIILFYGAGFISQKQPIKLTLSINGNLTTIAFPVYSREGGGQDGENLSVKVSNEGKSIGNTSKVVDLDPLAVKALEEQLPIIFTRQIARILSKTALSKRVQKNSSDLAFVATSLYTILSENADLRNWLLLPNNIQALRRRLAAGTHELTWQLQSRSGQVLDIKNTSVNLHDGDICLVNLRSIENRLFSNLKVYHQIQ